MRRDDRTSDDPRAIGAQNTVVVFPVPHVLDERRMARVRNTRRNGNVGVRLAVADSILVAREGRDRGFPVSRRAGLIGAHGRFKAPDSHARTHPALLVSTVLRSPSLSLSLFLLRLLSASQPGREERMRGSRSFIPRGGVQRRLSRCAIGRERAHASERAGGRARTSALP